jgi:peroxiredoxin/predicted 2-oxoglutarate/Fe(II)-dependent dioxygenase YbiX
MRFYGWAGGAPTVLFFFGKGESSEMWDTLLWFSKELNKSEQEKTSLFAVNRETPATNKGVADDRRISFPILSDGEGSVGSSYGIEPDERMTVLVLGPNLRIIEAHRLSDRESSMQRILSAIRGIPRLEPTEIVMQAPVLLVPEVLEKEVCKHLMEVWRTQGNVETGVEYSSEGHRGNAIIPGSKHRRDHVVTNEALLRELTSRVGRRLMPEIRKAFSFRATRFEGFKVACYDALTGGFFSTHRDNLSPATAHRRFALTLNLNEGYEGGYLRFPEYGPHLYRPGTGGSIVFSASLLHEVLEVTTGERFVLLSFLYGEEEARISPRVPNSGEG